MTPSNCFLDHAISSINLDVHNFFSDFEKGRIYSLEPMVLDLKTGRIKKDSASPDPRQEFLTKEKLMSEVVRLREKYSK